MVFQSDAQRKAIHAKIKSQLKSNSHSFVPVDHTNSDVPYWHVNRGDGAYGQPVKNTKQDATHEWNTGTRSDREFYANKMVEHGIDPTMSIADARLVSKRFNQLPDWFQNKMANYMHNHNEYQHSEGGNKALPKYHHYKKPECAMCGKSHIKNQTGFCPSCLGKMRDGRKKKK